MRNACQCYSVAIQLHLSDYLPLLLHSFLRLHRTSLLSSHTQNVSFMMSSRVHAQVYRQLLGGATNSPIDYES